MSASLTLSLSLSPPPLFFFLFLCHCCFSRAFLKRLLSSQPRSGTPPEVNKPNGPAQRRPTVLKYWSRWIISESPVHARLTFRLISRLLFFEHGSARRAAVFFLNFVFPRESGDYGRQGRTEGCSGLHFPTAERRIFHEDRTSAHSV